MRSRHFLLAQILSLLTIAAAHGQANPDLETGIRPFGSYDQSEFDSISNTNGNLTLHVPLFAYPQRGEGQVQVKIGYNNKGWSVSESCFNGTCTENWAWMGSFVELALDDGELSASWTFVKMGNQNVPAFYAYSPDGFAHPIYKGISTDGSGIYYNGYDGVSGPSSPVLLDNRGAGFKNSKTTWNDPNGNSVTCCASNSAITDTLGRSTGGTVSDSSGTTGCSTTPLAPISALVDSYPGPNGTTRLVKSCFVYVNLKTNFQASTYGSDQTLHNINERTIPTQLAVQSIIVYNGSSWTTSPQWIFGYGSTDPNAINYGDLTQVTLPTGGTISYTWANQGHCNHGTLGPTTPLSRSVQSRAVDAMDGTGPQTTTFGPVTTDPLGNQTVHTITGLGSTCSLYETQTDYYNGSVASGTLLKTVITDFTWSAQDPIHQLVDPTTASVAYVEAIRVTTKLPIPGTSNFLVSKVETDYNTTYGLLLEKREYEFGINAPGPLLRRTTNTYVALSNNSYLNANLLDYLASVTVHDGSGNQISLTTYTYDSGTPQTSGITTQHMSVTGPRGNRTSVQRWLNTTGATLNTTTSYYDTGEPYQVTDPRGHVTTFSYSSAYAGAYLTQTNVPDTGSPVVHHVTSSTYDFNTGLLTSFKDQNSQTTSYAYNTPPPGCSFLDGLGRLSSITYPDGGKTTYCYNDAPYNASTPSPSVITTKAITSSTNLTALTAFDGLGRTVRSVLTSDPDCASGDKTDTTYDALGRVHTISNPYCTTNDPTYGITTRTYDALGRTCVVVPPGGAPQSNCSSGAITGDVVTVYAGRATEVFDEGNGSQNVARISQVDGLGRLASLCEVAPGPFVGSGGASSSSLIGSGGTPAACGLDIAGTGFPTTYQYDALDNLLQVNQSGIAARTFTYDSLSRLTSASNPESGTICYGTYSAGVCQRNGYDANGNLTTKTDARNITTTYGYDALNRLTSKTYSDGTPTATFNYDQTSALGVTLTNTIGRKSSESTGSSLPTGSVFSYDPMGRLANNSQCTPQNCGTSVFAIQYTQYDLLGDLVLASNAAGVTFSYSYNGAARLTSMSSNFTDPTHPGSLLSQATYNAADLLKTVLLGNGLTETSNYNSRLRLTSLTAGTVYSLNMSNYAPNGDVLAANDSVNGNWTYSYDPFNRLVGSNENSGQAVYTYVYDRFGNRWQQNGEHSFITTFTGNNPGNPQNNNRMDSYSYDLAGNLLNDGAHGYSYDAENRLIQVDKGSTASYVYDAEGRRVRKTTASGALDFLYDAQGHKVAEVDPTGTFLRGELYAGDRHFAVYTPDPGPSGATFFIHADWLGTERARTNTSGTACETITSLPFGDGQTISDTCGDSAGDVSPIHFTGKERDSDSGLDNFGARYDSSSFGRFTSPDPVFFQVEMLTDPQRFNEYAYGRNNPLLYIDPSGEAIQLSNDPAEQQKQLNAICSAAGVSSDKCSYYLYANPVTDANGNTTYYVGIYTNGADGKGTSFQDLNDVAGAIGGVINDQRVVQLDVVAAGTTITDNEGGHRTIGPLGPRTNATPGASYIGQDGRWHLVLLDPNTSPGTLPGTLMYGGEPGKLDQGIMLAHEIGHIRGEWGLQSGFRRFFEYTLHFDRSGNGESLKLENEVRRLRDPNAPIRTSHDPY